MCLPPCCTSARALNSVHVLLDDSLLPSQASEGPLCVCTGFDLGWRTGSEWCVDCPIVQKGVSSTARAYALCFLSRAPQGLPTPTRPRGSLDGARIVPEWRAYVYSKWTPALHDPYKQCTISKMMVYTQHVRLHTVNGFLLQMQMRRGCVPVVVGSRQRAERNDEDVAWA